MIAALDHVFVLCDVAAPEASALVDRGFEEGPANTHPGQGTACRRFFFDESYLELPWVNDPVEAQREPARRTGLWERWQGRRANACPFGVVLRPGADAHGSDPPFEAWSYRPGYLPDSMSIGVARDVPLIEPAFFWLAFRRGSVRTAQAANHRLGRSITHVRIGMPHGMPASEAGRMAAALGIVAFEAADAYVLDLTLDRAARGETIDLRPTLPIRFHI